jgi:hypothetical protein
MGISGQRRSSAVALKEHAAMKTSGKVVAFMFIFSNPPLRQQEDDGEPKPAGRQTSSVMSD